MRTPTKPMKIVIQQTFEIPPEDINGLTDAQLLLVVQQDGYQSRTRNMADIVEVDGQRDHWLVGECV